jgi:cation-transporting ATPase 13A2
MIFQLEVLPAALTAGLVYAQNRLLKSKIYCISPRTINLCGTLDCFVFDKTGTLTEDGLDLKFLLVESQIISKPNGLAKLGKTRLTEAMATCHSIARIHDKLVGDPLDCKMFQFSGYELCEPESFQCFKFNVSVTVRSPSALSEVLYLRKFLLILFLILVHQHMNDFHSKIHHLGVVKQFPFSSGLQRMTVVVVSQAGNFSIYSKGSPEKIIQMSNPKTGK